MKIFNKIIFIFFASVLAVSCASSPHWYNNVPRSPFKFYGTGFSDLQSKEKSRSFAVKRARMSIAEQVSSKMQNAALDYYQENEKPKNSQAVSFVEEIARQIVNVEVKYTRIEKVVSVPSDGTYALLSLKNGDIRRALREKKNMLKLQAKIAKEKPEGKNPIPIVVNDDAQNIIQTYINSLDTPN